MISISVVVSIYNVEQYIEQCVKSLINQTLRNIEIILVDDGTKDQSGQIIDNLAEMDKRIKVIHKENGGLASARNAGLKIAQGEFIIFIDGDDWIDETMLEKLYNSAKSNDSDMSLCSFTRFVNNEYRSSDEMSIISFFKQDMVISGHENVVNDLLLHMIGTMPEDKLDVDLLMSCCRCLYKKQLLIKNNIKFKSERAFISEDLIFQIEAFEYINRVSSVAEPLYYYRCNNGSLTQSYRPERFEKECVQYEKVCELIEKYNYGEYANLRAQRSFIGRVRNCLRAEVQDNKVESFSGKLKNMKKILSDSRIQGVLREYPISRLKASLQLVSFFMRVNNSIILYLLFKLVNTKK